MSTEVPGYGAIDHYLGKKTLPYYWSISFAQERFERSGAKLIKGDAPCPVIWIPFTSSRPP
jgi:hypothetical protein